SSSTCAPSRPMRRRPCSAPSCARPPSRTEPRPPATWHASVATIARAMASSPVMIQARVSTVPVLFAACLLALAAAPAAVRSASAEEVTHHVGRLTVLVDESASYPGGLVTVRVRSRYALGTTYTILEGRRCPFFSSPHGIQALVPVPVDST